MPIQGLVQKRVNSDDGTEIYADAVGKPSLPSIVFIHGLSLSSLVFEDLFRDRTLLDKAYLVRYDLRGHGRSGKPLDPEAHQSIRYAQDFVAVVKAFNLNKPYLFGWSLGGTCLRSHHDDRDVGSSTSLPATIAADVLQHFPPAPLSGIIYAAALPHTGPIKKDLVKPLIEELSAKLFSTDVATALDARIKFTTSVFVDPDTVDHATFVSWVGTTTYITAEGVKLAISRSQDPAALLAAGKAGLPLLILYSDEDAHINSEVVVDQVGSHFVKKRVAAVPHAGHAVFYDGQDSVVAEIVSFIGEKTTE